MRKKKTYLGWSSIEKRASLKAKTWREASEWLRIWGLVLIKATEWQRTPEKEWKGEERLPLGHVESSMVMSI